MTSVEETVREFIVNNFLFGESVRMPDDEGSLLEHGIIDSTGILELVFFLESTYGMSVGDREMVPENLDSVARIGAFGRRKTAMAA